MSLPLKGSTYTDGLITVLSVFIATRDHVRAMSPVRSGAPTIAQTVFRLAKRG